MVSAAPVRGRLVPLIAGLTLAGAVHGAELVNPGTPPERQVFFGDLHVHTTYSNDAFGYNNNRTPDVAYRYAKGEPVAGLDGASIQLRTPLDFLAVTDHAEYLGAFRSMTEPGHALYDSELGRLARSSDLGTRRQAFDMFIRALRTGQFPEGFSDPAVTLSVWKSIVDTADAHDQPGVFTAFAGYEWTATEQGGNLHRNVIFEGSEDLPLPFAATDSRDPEDLWTWLERQRLRGVDAIAIPHNSNVSDGRMFALTDALGEPLDAGYAARRTWNEPLVEITQQKGTSETHPALSPNDEFADFELFTELLVAGGKPSKVSGGYVREAWLNGIGLQDSQGFNPFQFGVVGSTDNHSGTSAIEEHNFTGSRGPELDGSPELRQDTTLWGGLPRQSFSAAGLTGVWAEANTRESLFAAFRRRETYGTTGPQITVRLFAGWDLPGDLPARPGREAVGYRRGVPMGGVLEGPSRGNVPVLAIWAAKDPAGAHLDRIQVIKGWVDDGVTREQVYDVALSDPSRRGPDGVAPVGNSVAVETATYTNDIGAPALSTTWRDPDFDPSRPAFYYVRVIEIPTPRWTTYDAAALGVPPLDLVPATLQERAFTSPVWYLPDGQPGMARQP